MAARVQYAHGKRLILLEATLGDAALERAALLPETAAGTIVEARAIACVIATGSGRPWPHAVQAEGTRAMTAREYLAGHAMSPETA